MRKKHTPYLLLLPLLFFMGIFAAGLLNGVAQSFGYIPAYHMNTFTLDYYRETLASKKLLASIGLSLYTALISAVVAAVLGTLLCWCLVSVKKSGRRAIQVVKIPILVPHTVVALLMIQLFSATGIFSRLLYLLGVQNAQQLFGNILYTPGSIGVILAYLWKEIPFICYFVMNMMFGINESLGEAAMNLGAGRWRTFWEIILPICMPAVKNGFLIIFCYAFGAYELPFLLGATLPKALPVQAYLEYTHPDLTHRPYAMVLNTLMLAVSLGVAVLYYRILQKGWKHNDKS